MAKYLNVAGSDGVDVELLAPGDYGAIRSISIANTAGSAGTVSLFIQKRPLNSAVSTYYIIKSLSIPVAASFVVDNKDLLSFNNGANGYGLYMTVGGSDTFDVMIS
tara:strand:- start:1006 stop:1323 length:318 start_codon:yes stop_codon:yes gene_type:complete